MSPSSHGETRAIDGVTVREMSAHEADECEGILRSLPDWFGIEESIVEYRRDLEKMETFVAVRGERIVGFVTLHQHNESSGEMHVLAVRSEEHGRGIGRSLVERVEREAEMRGLEYMQVKTLGPSRECAPYERTRGFYRAVGYRPLEENALWGAGNPCLIFVKHLPCAATPE